MLEFDTGVELPVPVPSVIEMLPLPDGAHVGPTVDVEFVNGNGAVLLVTGEGCGKPVPELANVDDGELVARVSLLEFVGKEAEDEASTGSTLDIPVAKLDDGVIIPDAEAPQLLELDTGKGAGLDESLAVAVT